MTCHELSALTLSHKREQKDLSVVPDDGVAEHRAGDIIGRCLDGSQRFEFPLLLLLGAQLCLWFDVGLLPDLRLKIVRVVSAPSHQEHSANKGHKKKKPLTNTSQIVWV